MDYQYQVMPLSIVYVYFTHSQTSQNQLKYIDIKWFFASGVIDR